MRVQRLIDRTPWQPCRYVTPWDTADDCRHYAARDKAALAATVTAVIARMIDSQDFPVSLSPRTRNPDDRDE